MMVLMMLRKVASRWMTAVPTLPRESTGAVPSSWGNNYLINKLIANGGNIDLFPEFNGGSIVKKGHRINVSHTNAFHYNTYVSYCLPRICNLKSVLLFGKPSILDTCTITHVSEGFADQEFVLCLVRSSVPMGLILGAQGKQSDNWNIDFLPNDNL